MPVPKIQWQQTMLPPRAVHMELAITWVARADHALVSINIMDRPKGQQLSLCVGSVPDPKLGTPFDHACHAALADVLSEFHRHAIEQDPF